jgi:chromosome condensin MukBEF complex kleisin-like MukF subunit
VEHSSAVVRSLSELRSQAAEEVSRAATGHGDAARPYYRRAATLLAALRFYAQERGFDGRWVHEMVAAGNLDAIREVARALHQQGDADSIDAARSIEDVVRTRSLRERRCVLATANITLWRISTA